jgi:hypothetical protein
MNIVEFRKVKDQWITELAASMSQTLAAMGDRARYVDMVSMQPAIDAYHAERMPKAA